MPKYTYTALDLNNRRVNGREDARDEDDLRRILRTRQLVPVQFSVVEEKDIGYRMKPRDCTEFSRQLGSMLSSGITVVRALELIRDGQQRAAVAGIVSRLHKEVSQGVTLSEAMRKQGNAFPELLINMFASGEVSGQLEKVADKMAIHYDKENRLNGKVQGAMFYPMILAVVTVLVVLLIFVVIIPEFLDTLTSFNVELPFITRAVMAVSDFLTTRWLFVLLGAIAVVALWMFLLSRPGFRHGFDKFKTRIPVMGNLLKTIYTARFARTLCSLYTSGIPMIGALEITTTIIGNKFIEKQFQGVVQDVRNGEALNTSIGKVDGMQKKLSSMILIGEESGRLDTMLESTAEAFDYDAEQATGRLVQLVEPIMLIIMAGVIGVIMMSVLMPVFSMYNNADSL